MDNEDCKVNVCVTVDIITGRKTATSKFSFEDANIGPVAVLFKVSEWMDSLENKSEMPPEIHKIVCNGPEMPPELKEILDKILKRTN